MPVRESIPITDQDLIGWKNVVEEKLIKIKGDQDIRKVLSDLSKEESWLMLPEETSLIVAIRLAMSLYYHFVKILNETTGYNTEIQTTTISPSILAKREFISAFSLFVMARSMAVRCRELLKNKDGSKLAKINAGQISPLIGKGYERDLDWTLSYWINALQSPSDEGPPLVQQVGDTLSVSKDFWEEMAKKSTEVAKKHPKLLALIEDTTFRYGNFTIHGLSADSQEEIQTTSWKPVQPHEVIGDPEVTEMLLRNSDRIALYDVNVGKNPVCELGGIMPSLFVDGPPGTGKTHRQQMVATHMSYRAEQIGIPFQFKVADNADLEDQWYGQTAKLARDFFNEVTDPGKITLLAIDDMDMIIGKRKDAQGGDKSKTQKFMDFFSGIGADYNGNHMTIAATNAPTDIEPAVRQRFVYKVTILGAQTANEFSCLVHAGLKGFAKTGCLKIGGAIPNLLPEGIALLKAPSLKKDVGSWDDIGDFCESLRKQDERFTGRAVKNALQVAIAEASTFEIPEEWFTDPTRFRLKSWEERVNILKELYSTITADQIIASIQKQFDTEKRYANEARQQEIIGLAEKLTTQKEASRLMRQMKDKRE